MSSENPLFAAQERRLALVIGVNEAPFAHQPPLKSAQRDAEAVAQTLQEHCGFTLLKPPLLGTEATSANVKKAILALARERSDEDFLLLYFSGHGQPMQVSGDQSDIYLVTSDFSEADTEEDETLHCSMRWLQDKLYLPTHAGKVLLILDCCYSGNMGRTAPDPYLEDLKMRILKYFGPLGTASGARAGGLRLALTATGHNQSAAEQEGYGVLTWHVLECLRGQIDDVIDLDDRGNVSLQRLHDYLLRVMPKDQNPSVAGDYAGRKCILANYEQRATELRQQKRTLVNELPRNYAPRTHVDVFERQHEFSALAKLLFASETKQAPARMPVVGLIGIGGIGKSRLAIESAYEFKERFPAGIFWMTAVGTSLAEWQHQLAELAANTEYLPASDDVSHPENEARRARHIARYLAQQPAALLLLDNVEQIEQPLAALTTFAGEELRCTVLYTARTDVAPPYVKLYRMHGLPEEGALRILLERRPTLLAQLTTNSHNPRLQPARAICQYVDFQPLALTLLRDLLQDTHLTLTHLDQQLRKRGALKITSEQDVTDTRLYSTFLLSWRKVRNPDAQRLFKLASTFPEAQPIPLWLLALAANLEGNTSLEPLGKARLELQRLSLIEELPGDAFRLHPLLRECALYLLETDSERDALMTVARTRLLREFTDPGKLERRVLDEGYWTVLERLREVVSYMQLQGVAETNLLERVEYWLARDSSLLGSSESLWPRVLPGLFYQQLYNRALEEGYQIPGTPANARWIRQLQQVGVEDSSLLREFRHPDDVSSVAFSPDSRLVVTGCDDSYVRVWDAESGRMLQLLTGHNSPIIEVAFSPDGVTVAACSFDTEALLWNIQTGQSLHTLRGHTESLRNIVFSPDGKYVATRSGDKTVRIWDVATGKMVSLLLGHANVSGGLALSPDSKLVAIISPIVVNIWEREHERLISTLTIHMLSGWFTQKHLSLVFSPDGESVVFGLKSGVSIWNITQPEALTRSFDVYPSASIIEGTALSFNAQQIAVIRENTVEVLQVEDLPIGEFSVVDRLSEIHPVASFAHGFFVSSVAFSLDATKVATSSFDGTTRVWHLTPFPEKQQTSQSYFEVIAEAIFSLEGKYLLTGSKYCVIQRWNITDGSLVWTLHEREGEIPKCLAFSATGKKVAFGLRDSQWILDIEKNQEIASYTQPASSWSRSISSLALSPNELMLASAMDQMIQVWNIIPWEKTVQLFGHKGDITQLVFSSDSSKLVSGATDMTVCIWEVSSGRQLAVMKEYGLLALAISPDGRMVASGARRNAVHISSMDTGERLLTLEGHSQSVTLLSFSPGSRMLISADQSGLVLFWRVDGRGPSTPLGVALAVNEIIAVHWHDERHVILADRGGMRNQPHFYHLALEGAWEADV